MIIKLASDIFTVMVCLSRFGPPPLGFAYQTRSDAAQLCADCAKACDAMADNTHFVENLAFAIASRFGQNFKDDMLAHLLNADRTTANRLRNGKSSPHKYLSRLTKHFGVREEIWTKTHEEFVSEYLLVGKIDHNAETDDTRRVDFVSIRAHQRLWRDCFDVHQGQYIAYWKASTEGYFMASLLSVDSMDRHGIKFRLINPYVMEEATSDAVRVWKYEGVMYPIENTLYFFAEQVDKNFEIMTMITSSSPISPPDLLFGCLTGVYVQDGRRRPAVNIAVVLFYQPAPILNWTGLIGKSLGRIKEIDMQKRIVKFLNAYPGVIILDV